MTERREAKDKTEIKKQLVAGGRPRFFVVSVVTGVEGMLGADSGTETTGAHVKERQLKLDTF